MSKAPLLTAVIHKKIEFYDLDPMRVVWHGRYIKYFESARCKLFEKIGFNYDIMESSGYIWPVVDLRIKFVYPAVFKQKISVRAELVEYETRLKIRYVITDVNTSKVLTKGYSIQVAVDNETHDMQYTTPSVFKERLFR